LKKRKVRNKFEERTEKQLKKSGVRYAYEAEKIPYYIGGHYLPDFIISTPLGKIYIECKGYFRPEAKRKLCAVKRLNPQLDIRLLFYSKSKVNIKWAERYGFKYAIGKVPKDWINGL